MADLVLFGASHAAETAAVYLTRHTDHRIVGFTADRDYCQSGQVFGKPLVPWDALHEVFPPSQVKLQGPYSYHRMNKLRRERYLEGKARGYEYVSFVHPDALVYADAIGENCFILAQNIIEPRTRIGNNVVMWGNNYIAHHSTIGDHCFFSAHITVSGSTPIGEMCFFGGKVHIGKNVVIGNSCFFGEGVQVLRQVVPDHSAFVAESTPRARYSSARLAKYL